MSCAPPPESSACARFFSIFSASRRISKRTTMRLNVIQAIYRKEMLDLLRDRRTLISMLVVPLVVFPLIMQVALRLTSRIEERSAEEAKTLGIAAHVSTPGVREALAKTGIPIMEREDLA